MTAHAARTIVDGNVLAGLLTELFAGDVTSLTARCGGCGSAAPLADAVVELDARAAIVRCRACTRTLLTMLRDHDRLRLTIGSLAALDG